MVCNETRPSLYLEKTVKEPLTTIWNNTTIESSSIKLCAADGWFAKAFIIWTTLPSTCKKLIHCNHSCWPLRDPHLYPAEPVHAYPSKWITEVHIKSNKIPMSGAAWYYITPFQVQMINSGTTFQVLTENAITFTAFLWTISIPSETNVILSGNLQPRKILLHMDVWVETILHY